LPHQWQLSNIPIAGETELKAIHSAIQPVINRALIALFPILFIFLGMGCSHESNSTGPDDDNSDFTRTAHVTYIYDGDTIQVNGNEKIRYTGIDTPEIGRCYYQEATNRNRELTLQKDVTLAVCKESPTDQYGRTLAHVKVGSVLVNAILIQEGYAESYRVPPCTDRANEYEQYENEARSAGRGRWSACN
jgi:micrococcal nuclease